MNEYYSCRQAVEDCVINKAFTVAHLYKEEKAMDMHIHDCYEIYYSISGGKQFLIDNKFYSIEPGDIFIINQYESHKLTQVDKMVHERIVLSVHPEYIRSISTEATNLDACFSVRPDHFSHKITLSKEEQTRFRFFINKITKADGYAHDIIEQCAFIELMVMLNHICGTNTCMQKAAAHAYHHQVDDILNYINGNITSSLSIEQLSAQFYLSESYICRIFKQATGTTINKYISARRISIAKSLLNAGNSVMDAYEKSGFSDYSNFFKAFTKAVGISPKKYARYNAG